MGLGAIIRDARRSRGWSQRDLADHLCRAANRATLTRAEIGRWERGEVMPGPFWLAHLAHVLTVPLDDLRRARTGASANPTSGDMAIGAAEALRVACDWLVEEPPHREHLAAGRVVGRELVDHVRHRAHELRLLDDHLGGVDTMTLVDTEVRRTETVLRDGSYTEGVRDELLRVLADLYQLAGWTASDAGQHQKAARLHLDGVTAARAGGDPLAAGNLLSSLAYQVANVGNPADAVTLARAAVHGARHAPAGTGRALLLERLAWAHARAGDNRAADAALDQVHEAASGDAHPPWAYWLDNREIAIMAGRCYVELHRPLRAVPLLTDAIGDYPADRPRETALYLTWLAQAYAQANEHDLASHARDRAYDLAGTVNSDRLHNRIRDIS